MKKLKITLEQKMKLTEEQKKRVLDQAYALGIKLKPVEAVAKPTAGIIGVEELKEALEAGAKVTSAIINEGYNVLTLGTALFKGIVGGDEIPGEFDDLDENEFIECYEAFADALDFNDPDDKDLELFIEKTFFNQFKQTLDTRDYLAAKAKKENAE